MTLGPGRSVPRPEVGDVRGLDLPGPSGAVPAVFVHGLAGVLENWERTIPCVAGRRVVALDLPGFGLSDRPDASYDRPFFRRCLASLGDALALGRAAWIGHSLGGRAVLDLAAHEPDRCAAVVGVAPAWRRRSPFPMAHRMLGPLLRTTFLTGSVGAARVREGVVRSAVPMVLGKDRSGADRIFEMTWPYFQREGAGLTISILERAASSILADPIADAEIRAVRAPVLIAWGTHDRVMPVEEGDRLHALLPQARYERWDGVGHLPMFERPDAFRDVLLPFLSKITP